MSGTLTDRESVIAIRENSSRSCSRLLGDWLGLLPSATRKHFPPKESICRQGDASTTVFLVGEGIVKLVGNLPNGEQAFLGLRLPGTWVGVSPAIFGVVHPLSAIAATKCCIYQCDSNDFREVLRNNRRAASLFIEDQARALYAAADTIIDLKLLTAQERFDRLFRTLQSVLGVLPHSGRVKIEIPLTKNEIAKLIGVSPQHFSKMKNDMQSQGRYQWQGRSTVAAHSLAPGSFENIPADSMLGLLSWNYQPFTDNPSQM